MNHNKLLLLLVGVLLWPDCVFSQNNESGYFVWSYANRHELNPAFEADADYIAFPGFGNLNVGMTGNLALDRIFYPNNGKLELFTSDKVSAHEVLSNLDRNNRFLSDIKIQLLGAGFHAWDGYNTIGLNIRVNANTSLPYELFDFVKNTTNKNYKINDVSAMVESFAELALGHSHKINDELRIGAKAKVLLGLGRMDAKVDNFTFDISNDNLWTARGHAQIEASVKGLTYVNKMKDYNDENRGQYETIDDIDVDGSGINGFGLAFDLGAEYDMNNIVKGLKLSMALLDLGLVNWNNNMLAENDGSYTFKFDGFKNVQVDDGPGVELGKQTDALMDDLKNLTNLQSKGDKGSRATGLGATLNVGAEYALPSYDKLKFGLLSTTRFNGDYSWNEERLSVDIRPTCWFEANASYGLGTFGSSFGCMMNFSGKCGSFFIAMDHIPGKLSKQGIPLNSNADLALGFNINIGHK